MMDMNKYLLVMFCVLTGCSSTVQMDLVRGMNADAQAFYQWYAQYSKVSTNNELIADFVRRDLSKILVSVSKSDDWHSPLDNLPELPSFVFEETNQTYFFPVQSQEKYKFFSESIPLLKLKGVYNIRAPSII